MGSEISINTTRNRCIFAYVNLQTYICAHVYICEIILYKLLFYFVTRCTCLHAFSPCVSVMNVYKCVCVSSSAEFTVQILDEFIANRCLSVICIYGLVRKLRCW